MRTAILILLLVGLALAASPVAEEFHNAFGVGETNTGINMADADGVALAAIQALCEQVKAQQAEIDALKAELKKK